MKKEATPFVVAFTPNYLIPAATCILSVLEHSNTIDSFDVICLLSEPLPNIKKEELRSLNKDRLEFSFIDLQDTLGEIYVNKKYTVAASYRLLLPELLPEYEKVIYIDCDVIVRNNIAKLYRQIELGDNYLAGVFEATLDFQLPHMKAIGCEPGEYINSGFLVMNLDLLRKDKMVPEFLEASKEEGLEFPDQDVLNKLCKGRILGLPPYYNSIRTFFLPQYKADFLKYYSQEDWNSVQSHGTIHYTGAKPWDAFTVQFGTWWKYYSMLPSQMLDNSIVRKNMIYLYSFYSTRLGRLLLDTGQLMYRKLKYF